VEKQTKIGLSLGWVCPKKPVVVFGYLPRCLNPENISHTDVTILTLRNHIWPVQLERLAVDYCIHIMPLLITIWVIYTQKTYYVKWWQALPPSLIL